MSDSDRTEAEVRKRFLEIKAKVDNGTATESEALEGHALLAAMEDFESVRERNPKPL